MLNYDELYLIHKAWKVEVTTFIFEKKTQMTNHKEVFSSG